jgi:hypothetical protein
MYMGGSAIRRYAESLKEHFSYLDKISEVEPKKEGKEFSS